MPSTVKMLTDKGLIHPPKFLPTNIHYETIMGSVCYGVSGDTSDIDVYGFAIPPRDVIFPHLAGCIDGFGRQKKGFNHFEQHHVKLDDKEYDLSIYNIVRYFNLCMANNPNMIDSLFTPRNCVLHITQIGERVREFRKEFLHKGSWQKFKGYAYSQMHKMKSKAPEEGSKRAKLREEFGFDVKYAYHLVRLLDEAEQILVHRDIDLQRNREQLKAIRRGEMKPDDIIAWATEKEAQLEKVYVESKIPWGPDEAKIKNLLLECLEMHYGSLEKCIVNPDAAIAALRQVSEIIEQNRKLLG